jgi:hypothetical protein
MECHVDILHYNLVDIVYIYQYILRSIQVPNHLIFTVTLTLNLLHFFVFF